MSAPFNCRWHAHDRVLLPLGRYADECARNFADGAVVRLESVEDRSWKSHDHQFAWVAEAWRQLPEEIAADYPNPKALRRRALIACGYYTQETFAFADERSARAFMAYAGEREKDEYPLILCSESVVIIRRAESQQRAKMGAKRFQESKTAILGMISELIGVAPETLTRETGRAA